MTKSGGTRWRQSGDEEGRERGTDGEGRSKEGEGEGQGGEEMSK